MFPFGGGMGGGMPMMGMGGMNPMMGSQGHPELSYIPDTSERANISPLALIKMLKHCKLVTQTLILNKWDFRSVWNPVWGHGSDARRVYRRIHCGSEGCFCNAPTPDDCQCRSSGSCIPSINAGEAKAGWQGVDSSGMVPLAPGLWLLAVCSWCIDLKRFRTIR